MGDYCFFKALFQTQRLSPKKVLFATKSQGFTTICQTGRKVTLSMLSIYLLQTEKSNGNDLITSFAGGLLVGRIKNAQVNHCQSGRLKRWVGIYTALPLMILMSMAIIASTSKACISDPAE